MKMKKIFKHFLFVFVFYLQYMYKKQQNNGPLPKKKFFGENKTMEYDTSIWKVKDHAVCDFIIIPKQEGSSGECVKEQ